MEGNNAGIWQVWSEGKQSPRCADKQPLGYAEKQHLVVGSTPVRSQYPVLRQKAGYMPHAAHITPRSRALPFTPLKLGLSACRQQRYSAPNHS